MIDDWISLAPIRTGLAPEPLSRGKRLGSWGQIRTRCHIGRLGVVLSWIKLLALTSLGESHGIPSNLLTLRLPTRLQLVIFAFDQQSEESRPDEELPVEKVCADPTPTPLNSMDVFGLVRKRIKTETLLGLRHQILVIHVTHVNIKLGQSCLEWPR